MPQLTKELSHTLTTLGLKPSDKRLALMKLLIRVKPQAVTIEDVYRLLAQQGTGLNTSSIAHAMADLERVGLLERSSGMDRRSRYRCRYEGDRQVVLPVFLNLNGERLRVTDAVLVERLHRFLENRRDAAETGNWPVQGVALEITVNVAEGVRA